MVIGSRQYKDSIDRLPFMGHTCKSRFCQLFSFKIFQAVFLPLILTSKKWLRFIISFRWNVTNVLYLLIRFFKLRFNSKQISSHSQWLRFLRLTSSTRYYIISWYPRIYRRPLFLRQYWYIILLFCEELSKISKINIFWERMYMRHHLFRTSNLHYLFWNLSESELSSIWLL